MGPLEAVKPWSMNGVEGVYRFLSRVWRLFIDDKAEQTQLNDTVQDVAPDRATLQALHRTIQKVEADTLDQVEQALAAGANLILLDNMTLSQLRRAAQLCKRRASLVIPWSASVPR